MGGGAAAPAAASAPLGGPRPRRPAGRCLAAARCRWCFGVLLALLLQEGECAGAGAALLQERTRAMQKVEQMYAHAFGAYMSNAFPDDELRPLSCDGRRVRERGDLDAVLGNYSMTLIDSLDSLVIFRRLDDFAYAVSYVTENVDFDQDLEVSTFEVNIRVLGGLLSGHLHALKVLEDYDGGLLKLGVDLAKRLKRAFQTPTGIPVSRVNLRKGRPGKGSSTVTIAEAGSFILEFGVVSLLTGDAEYYNTAKRALLKFWHRRSSLDLIGTLVDVNTGDFHDQHSTTGPGQDSFYEYLLKGYILFDDLELMHMFFSAYAAIERHQSFEGFTYTVDMFKGLMSSTHLSPLSCVWGALQVLAGDAAGGLRTVLYWHSLWQKHGALPEVFDAKTEAPTQAKDSPLRPELGEALFYLSMALPDDPQIFGIAESMITALDEQSRVDCGFAALADVQTKRLDDRMDSFFLSETLVYLYLAVLPPSELGILTWPLSSVVFSTEGHMFPTPQTGVGYLVTEIPGMQAHAVDLYPAAVARRPMLTCEAITSFERVAMQKRCSTKYFLTSSYQLRTQGLVPHQCRPQEVLVIVRVGDVVALEMRGTAASFGPPTPTLDGSTGGAGACVGGAGDTGAGAPPREPPPRLRVEQLGLSRIDLDKPPGQVPAFMAPGAGRHRSATELFTTRRVVLADPLSACSKGDFGEDVFEMYEGKLVVVQRGHCLFVHKMQHLQQARAAGVIVVNDEGHKLELQVMTCPLQERGAGRDVHLPSVMVTHAEGQRLLELLRSEEGPTGRRVTACMLSEH